MQPLLRVSVACLRSRRPCRVRRRGAFCVPLWRPLPTPHPFLGAVPAREWASSFFSSLWRRWYFSNELVRCKVIGTSLARATLSVCGRAALPQVGAVMSWGDGLWYRGLACWTTEAGLGPMSAAMSAAQALLVPHCAALPSASAFRWRQKLPRKF